MRRGSTGVHDDASNPDFFAQEKKYNHEPRSSGEVGECRIWLGEKGLRMSDLGGGTRERDGFGWVEERE